MGFFFSFQIANGHHPAEGHRGGRHGLQTAQRSSIPTRVRNPPHLVSIISTFYEQLLHQ